MGRSPDSIHGEERSEIHVIETGHARLEERSEIHVIEAGHARLLHHGPGTIITTKPQRILCLLSFLIVERARFLMGLAFIHSQPGKQTCYAKWPFGTLSGAA